MSWRSIKSPVCPGNTEVQSESMSYSVKRGETCSEHKNRHLYVMLFWVKDGQSDDIARHLELVAKRMRNQQVN